MKGLKKKIIIIGIVAGILAFAATGWTRSPQQTQIMNGYMAEQSGMEWMMPAFWGLVLGILILAVRWMSNLLNAEAGQDRSQKTALDILNHRFSVGEIDTREFETRKRILQE